MIKFLIDNSSLSELCSQRFAQTIVEKVITEFLHGTHAICFNNTNLFEQVKGIRLEGFMEAKQRLLLQAKIAKHGILPSPHEHLCAPFGEQYRIEAERDALHWMEVAHVLANCNDFTEFYTRFSEFQHEVVKQLEKCQYRLPFNDPVLIQVFVARYELGVLAQGLTSRQIRDKFPSVGYMRDVHKYYKEKIAAGVALRPGDYLDLEQVIYLDACDYFISEDRRLRDLVNNCGNESLTGRAITLATYLEQLDSGVFAPRRAPKQASMRFLPGL